MNGSTHTNLDSRIVSLGKTSFFSWMLAVFIDWFIIFLTLFLTYLLFTVTTSYSPVLRFFILILGGLITILIIGSKQHAIAILAHEGAHGLIIKPLWLNDFLVELFCFWPLGVGLDGYRNYHFSHHHNMGTSLDPELEQKKLSAPEWDLPNKSNSLSSRFIKDLFGLNLNHFLLFLQHNKLMRKEKTIRDIFGPIIWWIIVAVIIIYLKIWWVLLIWVVSICTSFLAFFRLRAWTEHVGTPTVNRIAVQWWQRIFLPHNTWYHYEHHRFSHIPFFNLPLARKLDSEEPIKTLDEVFKSYNFSKYIPSGTPLHNELEEKFKVLYSASNPSRS